MQNVTKIVKTIYRTHRMVDRLDYISPSSKTFLDFAAKSLSFTIDICGKNTAQRILLDVKEAPAAYVENTDRERYKITLPLFYFDEETLETLTKKEIPNAITSIALVNGSTIHESLHIKHTTGLDIKIAIDKGFHSVYGQYLVSEYGDLMNMYNKLGKSNIFGMFNFIEDIYIEAKANKYHKTILDTKNSIFFSKEDFEATKISVFKGEDAPQLLFIFMKREEFFNDDIFEKLLGDVLLKRVTLLKERGETSLNKRAVLAMDICKQFSTDERFSEAFEKSKTEDQPFGEDGDDADALINRLKKALGEKDFEKLMAMMSDDEESKGDVEISEKMDDDTESRETLKKLASKSMESEMRKISETEINEFSGKIIKAPERFDFYNHKIQCRYSGGYETLGSSSNWGFIKELKVLRSTKTVAGEPRDKGSRIVNHRLYRIATDQKIFASKTPSHKREVELIVLVDLSGSTESSGLYRRELSAAKEIHNAAIQSRMNIATVCHSSYRSKNPYWTVVASKGMATKNIIADDKRWNNSLKLERSENYDGYIIRDIAKALFTKRASTKVLIVLSDGSPCGPGYSGDKAADHTIYEINKLRKHGNIVFCISLIGGVVSSNNRIYGKNWNLDATKSGIIQKFRSLLKQIAKGEL